MRAIFFLSFFFLSVSSQAFVWQCAPTWLKVSSCFGGFFTYLGPALGLIIPKAIQLKNAQDQHDAMQKDYQNASNYLNRATNSLSEINMQIDGIPCALTHINSFNHSVSSVCNQTNWSLNRWNLNIEPKSDNVSTHQEEDYDTICEQIYLGETCTTTNGQRSCYPDYQLHCYKNYYTRTYETIKQRSGNWVVGDGVQFSTDCKRFGPHIAIHAIDYLSSTNRLIWTDKFRRTVENRTSAIDFSYQIADFDLHQILPLNKQLNENELQQQVYDLTRPLCNQSITTITEFSPDYWQKKNTSLRLQRDIQNASIALLSNITNGKKIPLDREQEALQKLKVAYRIALTIHLSILMVGAPLFSMLLTDIIYSHIHKLHAAKPPYPGP